MNAQFTQHNLIFKQASGTSRGVLTTKETYILEISEGDKKRNWRMCHFQRFEL
ncbi:MAG: hypothetical protein U0T78_09550 [Cloacibacterium normanense]